MPDLIGQSLGRYRILEQLGEGGMATVYKAYDTRLEREVAVKVIRVDQFAPAVLERILMRFDREAKALARLTHPNIVHINDYGEQEDVPYLVMDFLPGGTLKQRLGQPLPWQEAVKLLLPIAEALDYAHSQNIIHRDVKPSNILLTQLGQPMLTDFGISKLLESEETHTLSGTGMGIGTPEYMAPEQWTGQAGPQADLYSLGVVFYELVTGQKPYSADTPAAIMLKQANDPLPRPKQFVPGLSEAVEKVLFKALAKEPEDRYQGMSEFVAALERLVGAQTVESSGKPEGSSKEKTVLAGFKNQEIQATHKVSIPPVSLRPQPIKWWPWAAGLGVVLVVACVTLAALTLPRLFASPAPTPTLSLISTQTFTPDFTPTQTSTIDSVLTPTSNFEIGSTWMRPADGMEMVYIPEGTFTMGETADQAVGQCKVFFNDCPIDDYIDEQPPHDVSLDAFLIDQTEVTNAMYAKCVSAGTCQPPTSNSSQTRGNYYVNSQYAAYPVINVDWRQSRTYCKWAGARLPTEAEWEKAARSTDERTYPWGDSVPTCSLANFGDPKNCTGDTSSVDSYASGVSFYGLFNMAGNVSEWVNDWYSDSFYSSTPQYNPGGPDAGQERVIRGGSWYLNTNFIRPTNRDHRTPDISKNHIGFRCARSVTP